MSDPATMATWKTALRAFVCQELAHNRNILSVSIQGDRNPFIHIYLAKADDTLPTSMTFGDKEVKVVRTTFGAFEDSPYPRRRRTPSK